MRKPMLAGNWKMNKTRDEAIAFVLALGDSLPSTVDCVVCAPAIILRDLVKRSPEALKIGAQNMHEKENGAFTGEISPVMLKDTKVDYVILGHSERRAYFNETDAKINAKVKKALEFELKPKEIEIFDFKLLTQKTNLIWFVFHFYWLSESNVNRTLYF